MTRPEDPVRVENYDQGRRVILFCKRSRYYTTSAAADDSIHASTTTTMTARLAS